MVTGNLIFQRINTAALLLVLFGLVAGLGADEVTSFTPKPQSKATRILSFPSDQWVGNLSLEPASGPGWDPEGVRLLGQWEYLSAAQGDVRVPGDRNVKLGVFLALSPREVASLRSQNPQMHQILIADSTRKGPDDLSALSQLDPNDLFWLSVGSAMYRRAGVDARVFEPIRRLTGLKILTLSSAGVTDMSLEYLRPLRSLRGLELTQFTIGNRGLAVLKDLPALEYLSLNTGLTDAGLKQVAQVSSLRWLQILEGNIWGPGLAALAELPRLERLCIQKSRGRLFDRNIKYLEGLTQLKGLTLWASGCSALTDTTLASISKLRSLEELYFIRASPRFTPAGVAHLQSLKNLKKVDFAQTWISPAGERDGDAVVRQLAALPSLESIGGLAFLSASGMKTVATFRNLKCLHVILKDREQGYGGPTGLSHLAGLGSLEELEISSGDTLSDADLASLESLSNLKILSISGANVTDRGLKSIGKLKQLIQLDLHPSTRQGLNHLNGLSNLQYLQVVSWPTAAKTVSGDELMLDLSGLEKLKDLNLTGLPLQDGDLAFLRHLPLLEHLMIQPISTLPGASLRHLRELPELTDLRISGLSNCTGEDLANLNCLRKLRSLTVKGDIADAALATLTGPSSIESLRIETNNPIRKTTVSDLAGRLPVIEYIHVSDLTPVQTKPVETPRRMRAGRARPNRRMPRGRRYGGR